MSEKQIYKYALSVDFEGGDGPDLFPIEETNAEASMKHIDDNFTGLLFASWPPPKVEVVGLTKEEWEEAVKVGEERANE